MFEEYIPQEKAARAAMREIVDWVEAAMLAVVCVVLVFTFIVRTAGVEGSSMLPSLSDGDRLLITKLAEPLERGDIVVITKPSASPKPLVKRVIATGGQTIDINFDTHEVYVDGVKLFERYIAEPTARYYDMQFPQLVPEGHVFVMGDNRNDSWDSRATAVGMVDERHILGKVIYRISPYRSKGLP